MPINRRCGCFFQKVSPLNRRAQGKGWVLVAGFRVLEFFLHLEPVLFGLFEESVDIDIIHEHIPDHRSQPREAPRTLDAPLQHHQQQVGDERDPVSQKASDTLGLRMQGGPTEVIFLDVVKNRGLILDKDELTHYQLKMGDPVSIDDRMQLVVNASPNDDMLPYALYHATFFIDVETLAFTRAELSLDMSDKVKATRLMLVKKPRGVHFKPKELSLLVNYRYDDGLTHISYIRSTMQFNCDWKRRLFSTGYTTVNEMVVTDRQPCDKDPIDRKDAFKQRDSFTQMVNNFNDPDFWRDYNIIEPTESLEKAIKKLKKK